MYMRGNHFEETEGINKRVVCLANQTCLWSAEHANDVFYRPHWPPINRSRMTGSDVSARVSHPSKLTLDP